MTTPAHSPLPWRIMPGSLYIHDANDELVEDGFLAYNGGANARLIVAAVNSHAATPSQIELGYMDTFGREVDISTPGAACFVRPSGTHAELLAAAKRIIAAAHYAPNRGTFCDDAGAFKALSAAIANAEKGEAYEKSHC